MKKYMTEAEVHAYLGGAELEEAAPTIVPPADGWPEPEDRGTATLSALGPVEYVDDLSAPVASPSGRPRKGVARATPSTVSSGSGSRSPAAIRRVVGCPPDG